MTASHSAPAPFTYPPAPLVRRHGPSGYEDYESYRPWLRDEFSFRCVYCLLRERWGRVTGEFDLDHFVPEARNETGTPEYANLLYACHPCNLRKGARDIADPATALTSENMRVHPDGRIEALTDEAFQIIKVLGLNSPQWTQWRRIWIRNIELAADHDPEHHGDLMGYPENLPDLSTLTPPQNEEPDSFESSHFARRQRGELEDIYLY